MGPYRTPPAPSVVAIQPLADPETRIALAIVIVASVAGIGFVDAEWIAVDVLVAAGAAWLLVRDAWERRRRVSAR